MGKHIAIFIAVLVVSAHSLYAAPIVTSMQLDTENDLLDIGGGTVFDCNIEGGRNLSGGFPWTTSAGHNLYDNNPNSEATTQWNTTPSPALVGVYEMPMAYRLDGFAITVYTMRQNDYNFKIQGSNDSTNGYGGTWTDIYTNNTTVTVSTNSTLRWNSNDNTFLTSTSFNSFRLAEYAEYKRYAEVEFFGPAVPVATVIMIR